MGTTRHYVALDGLRGVAALSVVCLHVAKYFGLPIMPYHAYLAVDFFFMLSGFVIAHAYDDRLRRGMSVASFLAARLTRFQPLVALGVVLAIAVYLLRARFGGIDMVGVLQAAGANILLLPSPVFLTRFPFAFPLDIPLWSLAFEIWINLLYAVFFKALTCVTLGLALAVGAVLVLTTSLRNRGLDVGFEWHGFYLGGARVVFPFVMGILLRRYTGELKPRVGGTRRLAWTHAMFAPLLLVLCAPSFDRGWFDIIAVLFVFPLILLAASHAPPSRRLDPLWRQFGLLSYPVYVLHYPLVFAISEMVHVLHGGNALCWLGAAATFLLALAMSAVANEFYDAPARAWIARQLAMLSRPRLS